MLVVEFRCWWSSFRAETLISEVMQRKWRTELYSGLPKSIFLRIDNVPENRGVKCGQFIRCVSNSIFDFRVGTFLNQIGKELCATVHRCKVKGGTGGTGDTAHYGGGGTGDTAHY